MDAHVFRRVGHLLGEHLHGARLERVFGPAPGVTALSFFASGRKTCLLLRAHRSSPLLFLAPKSPLPNPAFPPAYVMRLRKYAEGRILGRYHVDWLERRMVFALPGAPDAPVHWLLLDLKHGPAIVTRLPEGFDTPISWPAMADTQALDTVDENAPDENAPWRRFQILTPALRQTLRAMDHLDGAALLVDLEQGLGDLFWYGTEGAPVTVSAWPLPRSDSQRETVTPVTAEIVFPLLEAMQMPLLLDEARTVADAPVQKQDRAATKKRKRLLANLNAERERLESLLLMGDDARLLQRHLWEFPPDARMDEVALPVSSETPATETRTIQLNPLMSLTENMQAMFRKAAKAQRGLGMLEKRLALASKTQSSRPVSPSSAMPLFPVAGPGKKNASLSRIQGFVSSDGFPLLRGRNADGNRDLLKLARPFDLWFHVEDGPSAHLLLRRDHAAQAVPEATLREAAVLVGLKSWRKYDPKASVMIALAKHVQPVKGASAGTVRVQEVMRTLLVDLDPATEERLPPLESKH